MNIHFFTNDPVDNAKYLDDTRARKLLVENLQMLATALIVNNVTSEYLPLTNNGVPFKISHPKHPSTLWTCSSRSNMLWLCDYTEALYNRYKRSGGKAFLSVPFNLARIRKGAEFVPDKGITVKPNCARSKELGIDHTNNPDIHDAYFAYMNDRWDIDTIKLTWTGV